MDYGEMSKAELIDVLQSMRSATRQETSAGETDPLLHELQVHQIELEMQNRALREAQRNLEESRDLYADLYDFAPLGYVTWNDKGSIEAINLTGASLIGVERSRLIGKPLIAFVEKKDRQKFASHLERCRKSSESVRIEVALSAKFEEPVHVELVTIAVRDRENRERCYRSAITDITKRLRGERERNKLEVQIQQSQKMESLGILAGGLAHDFNNLLTSIIGNAGLALTTLTPELPARDFVQRIETAALRAADLTKQMLAYSGKGSFAREPIDLSRLVEEMGQLLEASTSKKADLRYDLPAEPLFIEADAAQLTQVVMNLMINASEALGEGDRVITARTGRVYVDRSYLEQTYLREGQPEGDYVFLEVVDTGDGMDEETKTRMFDPFFTTKFAGRGLGLAAVLGIVRSHKGLIRIDSERGAGTTVKVLFPASERPARVPRQNVEGIESWRGSGTILVVDDETEIRVFLGHLLKHFGFQVVTADCGREALRIFPSRVKEIVAVLLDLTMPDLDGDAVFRELRRIAPDVKVLLMSGYIEDDAASRFGAERPAGFLQKPSLAHEIMGKLREVIEA